MHRQHYGHIIACGVNICLMWPLISFLRAPLVSIVAMWTVCCCRYDLKYCASAGTRVRPTERSKTHRTGKRDETRFVYFMCSWCWCRWSFDKSFEPRPELQSHKIEKYKHAHTRRDIYRRCLVLFCFVWVAYRITTSWIMQQQQQQEHKLHSVVFFSRVVAFGFYYFHLVTEHTHTSRTVHYYYYSLDAEGQLLSNYYSVRIYAIQFVYALHKI